MHSKTKPPCARRGPNKETVETNLRVASNVGRSRTQVNKTARRFVEVDFTAVPRRSGSLDANESFDEELFEIVEPEQADEHDQSVSTAKNFSGELRPLASYESKKVQWEWEPYVPKGMITMITGDPGSLKSYLTQALCALVTLGESMDGTPRKPGDCLYLTNENDPECVLRPRFDALGGDPNRIHLLADGLQKNGKEHQLTLADLDILEDMLRARRYRILVVDPIQSYLGSGVDAWRSNQTRPVLDGLGRLTRQYNVSTIVIRHARKSGGSRAIHRGLDSIDFTGAARSELLVGCSADGKERAMIHIKSNVGPLGRPMAFEILPGGPAGHFQFLGESNLTAADLSEPEKGKDSVLDSAKEFLREMLGEGELSWAEIEKERKIRGFANKTLQRAKTALGVTSRQYRDKEGRRQWLWVAPAE